MANITSPGLRDYEWLSLTSTLSNRIPLDAYAFATGWLPVFVCYYASAVLVCMPKTQRWRAVVVSLTVPLAYSSANRYDVTHNNPKKGYLNQGYRNSLFVMTMRMAEWSLADQPFKRTDSRETDVFLNALDLMFNFRGIGWTWSKHIPVPENTRANMTPRAFMVYNFLEIVKYEVLLDVLIYWVQSFGPTTIATTAGGTIYDMSLPLVPRYARSLFLAYLWGYSMATGVDALYHIITFVAFCIPGRHRNPALWPPLRGSPASATSLRVMWGREWHQIFRRPFDVLGAQPSRCLFGRVGGVLGCFALSEVFHAFADWGFGKGLTFPGFFVMMGVGLVLEHAWYVVVGRKVGGIIGWFWTMGWLLWWSQLYAEDLIRKGMAGNELYPLERRPAKFIVEKILHCWV